MKKLDLLINEIEKRDPANADGYYAFMGDVAAPRLAKALRVAIDYIENHELRHRRQYRAHDTLCQIKEILE